MQALTAAFVILAVGSTIWAWRSGARSRQA
jgi:hypothetical protein